MQRITWMFYHSEAVYKHSKEIAHSQSELQEGQAKMNENLRDGMSMLHDVSIMIWCTTSRPSNFHSFLLVPLAALIENVQFPWNAYKQLQKLEIHCLQKMQTLQNSADDIENMAGKSLDKQKQLLDGQNPMHLRSMLQHFAEYGHKQQEELLQKQEQLQKVHDHLVENSILAAQLFALQNAMLLESQIIKAFVLYTASIFIVYMFTSTKQTYTIRARLYVEVAMIRLTTNIIERQTWLINVFRLIYGILASIQFLHAIFTYRPETEEEKLLKEQIEHLKTEHEKELTTKVNQEPQQVSVGKLPSLMEIINEKERELEILVHDLDDKVRFGPKVIERPGSGAGRSSGFSERPPSRPGSFDESRSTEFMDRPRSRGKPDIWTRPADERRLFQGGRERGFLGSRDFDRQRTDRWYSGWRSPLLLVISRQSSTSGTQTQTPVDCLQSSAKLLRRMESLISTTPLDVTVTAASSSTSSVLPHLSLFLLLTTTIYFIDGVESAVNGG
ncbi:hypothetical protein DKX38_015034 [Salix brachista]|uniref:Uncharacterized protein n=1 Tax=Salix brachista TaxID=2182728 RepID=A0A5N5L5Z0_9ROSI|nr:hypothetical protein DKX38_015034 [Salix brachista]